MFKFQYQNGKKRKRGKKFPGLQNGAIRRLKTEAGFRDYKLGREGLQKEAALGISNRGKKITNRAKEISNRGKRDFKSGQGLQIGAEQKYTEFITSYLCR